MPADTYDALVREALEAAKVLDGRPIGYLARRLADALEASHEREKALEAVAKDAAERMDRARNILTKGNPTPHCNWGMLDARDIHTRLHALTRPEAPDGN